MKHTVSNIFNYNKTFKLCNVNNLKKVFDNEADDIKEIILFCGQENKRIVKSANLTINKYKHLFLKYNIGNLSGTFIESEYVNDDNLLIILPIDGVTDIYPSFTIKKVDSKNFKYFELSLKFKKFGIIKSETNDTITYTAKNLKETYSFWSSIISGLKVLDGC